MSMYAKVKKKHHTKSENLKPKTDPKSDLRPKTDPKSAKKKKKKKGYQAKELHFIPIWINNIS